MHREPTKLNLLYPRAVALVHRDYGPPARGTDQIIGSDVAARNSLTRSARRRRQNVICLTLGTSASSLPGTSSASRRAVAAGVLPARLTSSSAPQRINVGTFTFGALPRVS